MARSLARSSSYVGAILSFASLIALPTGPAYAEWNLEQVARDVCTRMVVENSIIDAEDREAVRAFYRDRECRPIWADQAGPTRNGARLIAEIKRADEWGLDPAAFKLTANEVPKTGNLWSPEQAADADIELTALALRYAHQAQGARIPDPTRLLSSYIDRQPEITPAAEVLARVAGDPEPGKVLISYQPIHDQFHRLKALLAKLRGKNAQPLPPQIAARGDTLQLGSKSPEVAILKKRFGIAATAETAEVFDQALADAVMKFQDAQDLGSDGVIGPMTRRALAPADLPKDRIATVIANMEEWRWMPRTLSATHIFVNIPSFSIKVVDDWKVVFEERVIVGTQQTQTPIFSKSMTTIVLKPEWYLPESIKVATLMSGRSMESMGYVVRRNGRVVDSSRIRWSKNNINEYTIAQPSGDDNALGLVKLLFPNKHSVYLHDTPSKSLFNSPVRLFSHGCMRVRNPQDLAQELFNIDLGDDAPAVKALVRKGPMNNQFTLNRPIPVHVGYFTAWVDEDGAADYFSDYYGHQKRIELALAGKWKQIDVGRDHLASVDTSMIDGLRLSANKKSKKKRDDEETTVDPPMGVTKSFSGVSYRPRGDTVGDMIRRSLGY